MIEVRKSDERGHAGELGAADSPATAPSGQFTLSDGSTTVNFNLPDGFTLAEPSAANHRTLKTHNGVTQLTLLPSDQPIDPGSAVRL